MLFQADAVYYVAAAGTHDEQHVHALLVIIELLLVYY